MDLLVGDFGENTIRSEPFVMNNSDVLHDKNCISAAEVAIEGNISLYTKSGGGASNDLNTYKAENSDYREDLNECQLPKLDTDNEFIGVLISSSIDDRCGAMNNYEDDEYKNECSHFTTCTAHNTPDLSTQNQLADAVLFPPISSGLQYVYSFSPRSKLITTTTGASGKAARRKSNLHEPVRNPGFHYANMWYPNTSNHGDRIFPSYRMNRFQHYESAGTYQKTSLTDGHHLSSSGREARNRAEKNRRDKLNGSIQELSTLVPHVAESARRVDKTAVLRLAAHGLRLHYTFRDKLNLNRPQLTDSLMKVLDSIFITLTSCGQIVLISSSIEQHLGHCQVDLYGQNILSITHPEDHDLIKHQLVPSNLETLFCIQTDSEPSETKQRTQSEEEYIDKKLREDRRSFTVRLARAGPRSEPTSYELVQLHGCFRRSDSAPREFNDSSSSLGIQLLGKNLRREDTIPLHTISGNDIIFVAIARVIRPSNLFKKILEANSLEYKTRHLIDGRIIDCDQRIGVVAGYMTEEVKNLSPFTFMHQDDVRWVIVALRQMYDCNSSYGESTYRLLTRNGYFIYLQSKGYLEIDKKTNTVHSFLCINTLLDEEEGKRRVDEMKKKFSVIINKKIPTSSVDVPASENPQQLVKAVLCLIQNLQKSPSEEKSFISAPRVVNNMTDYPPSPLQPRIGSTYPSHSAKTSPLALVPPEPASVKTSISKSVSVVNVTAAKHLLGKKSQQALGNERSSSPTDSSIPSEIGSFNGNCVYQSDTTKCDNYERMSTQSSPPVPFKRKLNYPPEGNRDLKIIKRHFGNADIHHVIFSSLDQLGRSLQEQKSAAIELQDQSNIYKVPHAKKKIKAIMEECQIQNEMFVNLKNEIQNQGSIETSSTKVDQQHGAD